MEDKSSAGFTWNKQIHYRPGTAALRLLLEYLSANVLLLKDDCYLNVPESYRDVQVGGRIRRVRAFDKRPSGQGGL